MMMMTLQWSILSIVIPVLRFIGELTHHDARDARWTPIMMITMITASEVDDDDDDDDDALID